MISATEKMLDRLNVHQIDVLRFEAGLRKSTLQQLRSLEKELVSDIAKLDPTAVSAASYRSQRLQALLLSTRKTIATAYRGISFNMQKNLRGLAYLESSFMRNTVNAAVGVNLAAVDLSTAQIAKLMDKQTLIAGAKSGAWWSKQSRDLVTRFGNEMRSGVTRGETLSDLVRRVRGRKENAFKDAIMRVPTRNANALVRTSVQAVANEARNATYAENDDVIDGVMWVSTLDGRTTPICIARSGKRYTLEHKPVGHSLPWQDGPGRIHWSCRSTSTPLLKTWQQLARPGSIRTGGRKTDINAIFERKLREAGFSKADIAQMKRNTRASMDGQVPQDLSFDKWLRGKSRGFREEVLGAEKNRIWENGGMPLRHLIDQTGRELSLEELTALKEAEFMEFAEAPLKGISTGKTKVQFFFDTFVENENKKMTDAELQALWDAEFPPETHGTRYTVTSQRAKFNRGGFGEPPVVSNQYGEGGTIIKKGKAPGIKITPVEPKPKLPPIEPTKVPTGKLTGKDMADKVKAVEAEYEQRIQELLQQSSEAASAEKRAWSKAYDMQKGLDAEGKAKVYETKAYKDLKKEEQEAMNRFWKLQKQKDKLRLQQKQAVWDALKAEEPAKVFPKFVSSYDINPELKKIKPKIKKGIEAFQELIGKQNPLHTESVQVGVEYNQKNGGSYLNGVVYFRNSSMNTSAVIVHELGHWFEDLLPGMKAKGRAFLKSRAGDAPIRPLAYFGPDTKGWKDKFKNPYSGRWYSSGFTEIISTGFEQMYENPMKFLKSDREFFEFIMDLIMEYR